jgi:hypothetical protein
MPQSIAGVSLRVDGIGESVIGGCKTSQKHAGRTTSSLFAKFPLENFSATFQWLFKCLSLLPIEKYQSSNLMVTWCHGGACIAGTLRKKLGIWHFWYSFFENANSQIQDPDFSDPSQSGSQF